MFGLFKLSKGWPFKQIFTVVLYGRKINLYIRDRRAYLLGQRKDGQGLQPELIDLVRDRASGMSGAVFFDIGANYGEWTLALRETAKACVVVEPHPGLAKLLRENFRGLRNVEIHEIALCDGDRVADLYYRVGYSGGSSLHEGYISGLNRRVWWGIGRMAKTTVSCRGARSFIPEVLARLEASASPLILKIDVEGAESDILRDLVDFLSARTDWLIVLEFNAVAIAATGQDAKETWNRLLSLGDCSVVDTSIARARKPGSARTFKSVIQPRENCDVIVTPRRPREKVRLDAL